MYNFVTICVYGVQVSIDQTREKGKERRVTNQIDRVNWIKLSRGLFSSPGGRGCFISIFFLILYPSRLIYSCRTRVYWTGRKASWSNLLAPIVGNVLGGKKKKKKKLKSKSGKFDGKSIGEGERIGIIWHVKERKRKKKNVPCSSWYFNSFWTPLKSILTFTI